jgi:hypothetical protein
MTHPTFLRHAAAALCATTVCLQAHASNVPLPPEQHAGAAAYVSGGIGEGEARRFESAFKDYPLAIQLFEHGATHDVYTADAQVKIYDPHGTLILDQKSDGPFMLVRLPPGDYHVTASLDGHALPKRSVHIVAHGHAKTTFVFPAHSA